MPSVASAKQAISFPIFFQIKNKFSTLLLALFAAAVGDHLTSSALTKLGGPAKRGNACAARGAPYVDAKLTAN